MVPLCRRRSPLARTLLLGLGLGLCGCVTTPDPHFALSEPPAPSFVDRLLRRQPAPQTPQFEAAPQDPKDPVKLSLAYARLMEQSGQLDQAETHYARALDENPESVDALIGLGRLHTLAGRHDRAEQALLRALQRQPQSAVVLHGLGQSYAARQQWNDAAEILQEASRIEPANQTSQHDLAVALVQAGDMERALPVFARTVGEAEAHYNVGLILQRTGRLVESEQQLRIALAKKPGLEPAQFWLQAVQQQQSLPSVPPSGIQTAIAAPVEGPGNTWSGSTGAVQPVGYDQPYSAPVISSLPTGHSAAIPPAYAPEAPPQQPSRPAPVW